MKNLKKLYEGNLRKNFFVFALPLVLTILFSQAYNIINTIMAGKLLGDNAISAIGSTAPFISMISSIFWGYGVGFSVYVAMLFGQGDYKKMLNVIYVNLLVSSLVIIIVSAVCIIFYPVIFDFLNIEEAIRKEAFSYFAIYMANLIFLNLNWSFAYISNAIGLAVLPFIASVITNIINIIGNYCLIKYAHMDVGGTALATGLSAILVCIFYVVVLINSLRKLKIRMNTLYFSKEEFITSCKYSFPSMLQQSVMYLCTALVSPLTNQCGANAIAGYTVGMRLYDLNSGVYQNSNKTISNYIAQCVGAKKYNIISKGIRIGLTQTLLFLFPFLAATIFFAKPIAHIFLNSAESISYATLFMQFCMPFVLFNVINNLCHAIFRSAGAGKYLVISTVIYSVARFGYSYLLYPKFEMHGIYLAIALSWITEAVFGLLIYFSGKWKSKEYRDYTSSHSAPQTV